VSLEQALAYAAEASEVLAFLIALREHQRRRYRPRHARRGRYRFSAVATSSVDAAQLLGVGPVADRRLPARPGPLRRGRPQPPTLLQPGGRRRGGHDRKHGAP